MIRLRFYCTVAITTALPASDYYRKVSIELPEHPHCQAQSINIINVLHLATTASFSIFKVLIITGTGVHLLRSSIHLVKSRIINASIIINKQLALDFCFNFAIANGHRATSEKATSVEHLTLFSCTEVVCDCPVAMSRQAARAPVSPALGTTSYGQVIEYIQSR